MYKVMLVDDEKLILQGVLNIIDWDKLGLKITHMVQNGKEALEKYDEEPVDIIITDINMPVINGLELIKSIKEKNKKVKFIVLSGYDDFSYAKTAMKYGIENYILKPINEEELEEALIDINKKLAANKEKENKLLEKNNTFMKILNGNSDKEILEEISDIINIKLKDKCYTVTNILFNKKNHRKKSDINELINENTYEGYEILYRFNGDIILINSWECDISIEDIREYYRKMLGLLMTNIGEAFIAVGDVVYNINDLKKSYNISNNIKKNIITDGYNKCLYRDDIDNTNHVNYNLNKEIEVLNKIIIEKNKEDVQAYIEELFRSNKFSPQEIYDLAIKTILLADKIADDFKIDKEIKDESISNTIINIYNASSISDIITYIDKQIIDLSNMMKSNSVKYTPIIQQVVNYINKNYYEELSLKTLSQKYKINSSYLGQLFAKEVGYSFSEYLNKVKNMKAKDLILNTNMKINDIAKEVGYLDTSYFYRKFKNFYGVSPATLREFKNY